MGTIANKAPTQDQKSDSDLWLQGRQLFADRYKGQKKYASDLEVFLANGSTVEAARDECLKGKDKAESQYNKGDVVVNGRKIFPKALLGKIMDNIHYVVDAGNWLVQGAPESVGLAWMAVRTLIGAFQQDYAVSQYIIVALVDLTTILVRCRSKVKTFYETASEKTSEMEQQLFKRIPEIYSEILQFSFWVSRHFRKHNFRRFVPGMSIDKFTPQMEMIKKYEIEVTKDAEDVFQQKSIDFQGKSIEFQGRVEGGIDSLAAGQAGLKANTDKILAKLETAPKKTSQEIIRGDYEDNKKKFNVTFDDDVYLEALAECEDDTCSWVFETEQFKEWNSSDESLLTWATGKEGSGKTVLTASVVSYLQEQAQKDNEYCVAYHFCADGTEPRAERIKTLLVLQLYEFAAAVSTDLLAKCNDVVTDAISKRDKSKATAGGTSTKKSELDMDEVFEKLVQAIAKPVYVCLDALDQCSEAEQNSIIESLKQFIRSEDIVIKVWASSRPELDPPMEFGFEKIDIDESNRTDIELTVKARVAKVAGFTDAERALACQKIVEKADGTFRYVLQAIDFLKQPWQRPLSKRLESLPESLGASYSDALRLVDPNYVELLKTALKWTALSEVPVQLTWIMDDYRRTYQSDDVGSSEPPQDDNDQEVEATAQLRKAGSAFLLVSSDSPRIVIFKNNSIKRFFLDQGNFPIHPPTTAHDVCSQCRKQIDADPTFFVDAKNGHLDQAIMCLRHLHSTLFQSIHMSMTSADEENTEEHPEEAVDEELTGDAENSSDNVIADTDATGVQTNGLQDDSTENDAQTNNSMGIEDSKSPETAHDADVKHSSVNGEEEIENSRVEAEDKENEGGEEEGSNDDGSDATSDTDSDDSGYAVNENLRYEIVQWMYHLRAAESLSSVEERETGDKWQELWELLESLLCKNDKLFRTWQEAMWTWNHSWMHDYCSEDILKPLHVSAGFGLRWLTDKLLARGESLTSLSSWHSLPIHSAALGYKTFWTDLEFLKNIVHGADLNFESQENLEQEKFCYKSPFVYFLSEDCPIEFVQTLLDNGADCSKSFRTTFPLQMFSLEGSDPAVLSLLLRNGADINQKDAEYGWTPLHLLLLRDEVPTDLLRAYLEEGADVNAEDSDSEMPLYTAARKGQIEVVKILLEHGADYDDLNTGGLSALHIAAYAGQDEVVKALISVGATLNKPDDTGITPFCGACGNDNEDAAKTLYQALRDRNFDISDINKAIKTGETPLMEAAAAGNLDTVKTLLPLLPHSEIDAQTSKTKRTALHLASLNGRTEVVQYLLDSGADSKIKDRHGRTAMSLCHDKWTFNDSKYREECLSALIDHDKAEAIQNTDLLADAATKGSVKILEQLLSAGAAPDAKDKHDWTPILLAKMHRRDQAVSILEEATAARGARPSGWNSPNSSIKISEAKTSFEFTGKGRAIILSNHPIPSYFKEYYFEIDIEASETPKDEMLIAIGLSARPTKLAGWLPGLALEGVNSWGWHGDDGYSYCQNSYDPKAADSGLQLFENQKFGHGSTVGCGIDVASGRLFFTKNGLCLGESWDKVEGRLYPTVGMGEQSIVKANFGDDIKNRPFRWEPANRGEISSCIKVDKAEDEDEEVNGEAPEAPQSESVAGAQEGTVTSVSVSA